MVGVRIIIPTTLLIVVVTADVVIVVIIIIITPLMVHLCSRHSIVAIVMGVVPIVVPALQVRRAVRLLLLIL